VSPLGVPVQFRLDLFSPRELQVENWLKPEHGPLMLNNAIKLARNPTQAALLRATVERDIKRLGKPILLGMFERIEPLQPSAEPGLSWRMRPGPINPKRP